MAYNVYGIDVINPFLTNIGQVYLNFNQLIDGVLAFMLFFSIAHWVFSKKYPGKEGKMVSVAIGAILTFSFILLEQRTGFRFGGPEMGSFGWLVFMIVLAILLYELIVSAVGEEKKGCAMAFTFIVIHSIFLGVYTPEYMTLLNQAPLVNFILALLLIASLIKIIICIVGAFTGGGNHGDHGGGHDDGRTSDHVRDDDDGRRRRSRTPPEDPDALAIELRAPNHVNAGAPIRTVSHASGGDGHYEITLLVDGHPVAQTRGDTLDFTIPHLPVGRHQLTAHVHDGHNTAQEDQTVTVGPATGIHAVMTLPSGNAPDPSAVFPVNGSITVSTQVNGSAAHFDHWIGLFNPGSSALIAWLPITGLQNIAGGTPANRTITIASITPAVGVGRYVLGFVPLPTGTAPAAIANYTSYGGPKAGRLIEIQAATGTSTVIPRLLSPAAGSTIAAGATGVRVTTRVDALTGSYDHHVARYDTTRRLVSPPTPSIATGVAVNTDSNTAINIAATIPAGPYLFVFFPVTPGAPFTPPTTLPAASTPALLFAANTITITSPPPPGTTSIAVRGIVNPGGVTIGRIGGITPTFNVVITDPAGSPIPGIRRSIIWIPTGGRVAEIMQVVFTGVPASTPISIHGEYTPPGGTLRTEVISVVSPAAGSGSLDLTYTILGPVPNINGVTL